MYWQHALANPEVTVQSCTTSYSTYSSTERSPLYSYCTVMSYIVAMSEITLLDKVAVALINCGSCLTCQICLALFVWLSWLMLADCVWIRFKLNVKCLMLDLI